MYRLVLKWNFSKLGWLRYTKSATILQKQNKNEFCKWTEPNTLGLSSCAVLECLQLEKHLQLVSLWNRQNPKLNCHIFLKLFFPQFFILSFFLVKPTRHCYSFHEHVVNLIFAFIFGLKVDIVIRGCLLIGLYGNF